MQKKKSIPLALKSEVLAALQKPGSVLTNIAKSYGISRSTIYLWRGFTRSSRIKTPRIKRVCTIDCVNFFHNVFYL